MEKNLDKTTSLSALNKAIKGIATSAVKLNNLIHATAVMAMEHTRNFNDATGCARLVDALPMNHRRALLISWFDMFSPIRIGKNAGTGMMKAYLAGKADERDALWNVEGAKATPFFAIPPAAEEPDVPFLFDDFQKKVISIFTQLEKKANAIENEDDKARALGEIDAMKKAANKAIAA